ncbi:PDDEXK nuclease domain-containing protein [Streptomyces sp. G45]|uniref:PDDEXK nuclease domain-containing protein n=1 Tax=Streptomyces sp. G45 TaxID=3406627 RepID=UPI003C18300E
MHRYEDLLAEARTAAEAARVRARRSVNTELVQMYWHIGKLILARQHQEGWGTGVVARLAADLGAHFPHQRGFSYRNLVRTPKMAHTWPALITHRPVAQLPWRHVTVLLDKLDTRAERDFYATEAVRNGWSRAQLNLAIRQRLHVPQGSAPIAHDVRLPDDSPALEELAGDPYRLDFLRLDDDERVDRADGEAIAARTVRYLTGLGTGFAFVGCRHPVPAAHGPDVVDLLFYHLRLHRYVAFAIDVKGDRGAQLGKLAAHTKVIDDLLCDPARDGTTLGVLIEARHGRATYAPQPLPDAQLLPSEEDLSRVIHAVTGPLDPVPSFDGTA